MRGTIPKLGLLSLLAISMVGCGAPTPIQSSEAQKPANNALEAVPSIPLSETIQANEMVKGEEPDVIETQQRGRRPYVRWRRTIYGGRPYYVPYYYYYWYPRPYYVPYYSGNYWYYYDRPGFRYRGRRFRHY
jgi:hypothetical protein